MPEGHSVHRIARQFTANFVGTAAEVTSPQGRFSSGAQLIDCVPMVDARAVGKQLFLGFDNGNWLRVHLGIYGAWDFAGDVRVHESIEVHGLTDRLGQNQMRGTDMSGVRSATAIAPQDNDAEDSVTSIGAPRRARLRMSESERAKDLGAMWPPEPVGQVRARLLNESVCADLRGPTVCEVISEGEMAAVLNRLGPDPANSATVAEMQRFIKRAAKKQTPIAVTLMDQSVIAGIGNVYRAEMLFRAGINPFTPTKELSLKQLEQLWHDWVRLLEVGITVGQMITKDNLDEQGYRRALRERDARHWVYKKEGTPCEMCGSEIMLTELAARKLYWCPRCQK